jgi:hypothetical protein
MIPPADFTGPWWRLVPGPRSRPAPVPAIVHLESGSLLGRVPVDDGTWIGPCLPLGTVIEPGGVPTEAQNAALRELKGFWCIAQSRDDGMTGSQTSHPTLEGDCAVWWAGIRLPLTADIFREGRFTWHAKDARGYPVRLEV